MGYGYGPQDWLFMLTMMTVMTIATVIAVVAIVRAVRRGRADVDEPQRVLAQRYARGEISSEEFRERQQGLAQK